MRKLCLSTKFPHQDIRWNYGIFRSEGLYVQRIFSQYSLSIPHTSSEKLWSLVSGYWPQMGWEEGEQQNQPSWDVLKKRYLKICSKFTGEQSCRSVISMKFLSNFIEIALRHRCFSVNLLQFFRRHFPKNTSGRLLLEQSFFHNLNKIFVDFLMF